MMTCFRWILGYTRLEIWRKIGNTRVYVCVTVQATSQLATIVVSEPPITTVESVVQRTQVIQLGQFVTLSVQCVQRTQVMVEMCADPRLVTADTAVS